MIRRYFIAMAGLPAIAAMSARLHVRVRDKSTGATIPATVRITTATGKVLTESESFGGGFRSAGDFRKEVPAGTTMLQVSRGFDYEQWEQQLDLQAGEEHYVEVQLGRRTPLLREGWRCGDNHVHMIHGENRIAVDFEYVSMAAAAEALDYMSVAQRWHLPTQTAEAVEAACRKVSRPDCTLTWNMEAPKNYFRGDVNHCMGHCWFVGAAAGDSQGRDVVEQLAAMSAGDYQSEKTPTPNFESHALIHDLGGAVSYTHPCRWWWGKWGGRGIYPFEQRKFVSNMAQELPFDTLAGPTYDAIDILMQTREKEGNAAGQRLWFMLLNHGYRMPATASSDATFDNPGRGVPGKVRVYTKVGAPFSIERLVRAMKNGRNFVTSGPLLTLEIGGHQPGDVIEVTRPTRMLLKLRAWSAPGFRSRLSEVELIQNGDSVQRFTPSDAYFQSELDWGLEGAGWMVARCFGQDRDHEVAITNAIYWAPPNAQVPPPLPAKVSLEVSDPDGAKIGAACEVILQIGTQERALSRHEVRNGRMHLTVPATARLRISAPGYTPAMRSIFLDTPALLEPTLNMKPEHLLSWTTFEGFAAVLSDVRMNIMLRRG